MGAGYSGGVIDTEFEGDLPRYKVPGQPNTRYNYYQNGLMKKSVWTNEKGIPIISKHFTNHGNAKTHPNVPHYHRWGWVNGQLHTLYMWVYIPIYGGPVSTYSFTWDEPIKWGWI